MDKRRHQQVLSEPGRTNNKEIKNSVSFSTGYNGIFIVKSEKKKFSFAVSITHNDGFIQMTFPRGVYEFKWLFLKQVILPKKLIHFYSNQTFQQ